MYEFQIIEWTATEKRFPATELLNRPLTDLVATLNSHGQIGWTVCHVHEVMRDGNIVFLVFMQRRITG